MGIFLRVYFDLTVNSQLATRRSVARTAEMVFEVMGVGHWEHQFQIVGVEPLI